MPSKRRTPNRNATRKAETTAGLQTPRARGRSFSSFRLPATDPQMEGVMQSVIAGEDPEQLVNLLPGFILTDVLAHSTVPPGVCIDASHILRCAYQWIGVPAEVRTVTLTVTRPDGSGTLYGSPQPAMTPRGFTGHCLVILPTRQRVADLTVAQFPDVARVSTLPILGRAVAATYQGPMNTQTGAHVALQREHLTLDYQFLTAADDELVHRGPNLGPAADDAFFDSSMQVTAWLVALCATVPELRSAVPALELPRLSAMVDAVQGATWDCSEEARDLFIYPDGRQVRLRDIALPAGVPGPVPQTPTYHA